MDRYQRSLRRASQVSEMSIGVQPTEEVQDMDIDVTQVKSFNDMCVGTDLTMSDIEDMQKQNTSYKEQLCYNLCNISRLVKRDDTAFQLSNSLAF
ncbi:hypothetical protein F2P79_025987 [Pimephales promelas]|nr:hypothetical protein F2P79_025987 [Pimephales promelas]